ncbi:GntR family transcriptional regulator [Streptomyces sp. NPDC058683]|uniref:GntR family transcriptional regulator n=1 Tax=Streptomyces sp. NPDC058683 TaxID=3346597 RepID=UPI0036631E5F
MDLTSLNGDLERNSGQPLHIQLYRRLREAILDGRLKPGTRLPASRALQEQLGVARNTVLNAYTQLYAEGYIEGRQGSGTYVARVLPEDLMTPRARRSARTSAPAPAKPRLLSRRGQLQLQLWRGRIPAQGRRGAVVGRRHVRLRRAAPAASRSAPAAAVRATRRAPSVP